MRAIDLQSGDTIQIGWVLWRRSSLNCFTADLPGGRLDVGRPMRWKKLALEKPWRVGNILGWHGGGDGHAEPEDAMRQATALFMEKLGELQDHLKKHWRPEAGDVVRCAIGGFGVESGEDYRVMMVVDHQAAGIQIGVESVAGVGIAGWYASWRFRPAPTRAA